MLTHPESLMAAISIQFEAALEGAVDAEDDGNLWSVALGQVIGDANFLCENATAKDAIVAEIGRCSHWLRPHQTRWTADGGFAWPSGYGGSGFSRSGLPEFDWSHLWRWRESELCWEGMESQLRERFIRLRVAIPSRTCRHDQAAVHTIWMPGCPTTPKEKLIQFYGFRKSGDQWKLTAYHCSNDKAYDYGALKK